MLLFSFFKNNVWVNGWNYDDQRGYDDNHSHGMQIQERIHEEKQSSQHEHLSSETVRFVPCFFVIESPWQAEAYEIIFSDFSHVVANDDE